MTYLKKIIFILVIAGFFITPLSFIHAQNEQNNNGSSEGYQLEGGVPSTDGSIGGENNVSDMTIGQAIKNSTLVRALGTVFTFGKEIYDRGVTPSGIYASVGAITLSISNYLFNASVNLSVVKFSKLYKDSESTINNAWKIGRDLANFFFIFILLYIAISTILDKANWQKLLARVLIIALLINFSAIIPKVVIDASNILALAFYDNIGNQVSNEPHDLTAPFLNSVTPKADGSWGEWLTDKITFGFGNFDNWIDGTMMFILTYILLVAAILFIIRVGVLILLIILSPLAFLGWAVPAASSYSNQWWQKLTSEAIFAPAFMFLLYATIQIVSNNTLANNIKEGIDSYTGQIIYFLVVVTFLTATLTIAKKFSSTGAGIAIGWGNKVKKLALGGAALGAGVAGAYTLGKGARAALKSDTFQNFAARNPFVGNLANAGLSSVAKKKFGGAASYEDRVEKTASRIEDFKTPERRYAYLNNLGEIDRKAAYGKLSDRQKAELHEYNQEQYDKVMKVPVGSTPPSPAQIDEAEKIRKTIEGLGPKPGTEPYEKMEAEREKIRNNKNIKEALTLVNPPAPATGGPAPTPNSADVQKGLGILKGKNINKLEPATLTSPNIAPYLSKRHLSSIKDHPDMKDGDYDTIRNLITAAANRPSATPSQKEALNWLNGPGGQGF